MKELILKPQKEIYVDERALKFMEKVKEKLSKKGQSDSASKHRILFTDLKAQKPK